MSDYEFTDDEETEESESDQFCESVSDLTTIGVQNPQTIQLCLQVLQKEIKTLQFSVQQNSTNLAKMESNLVIEISKRREYEIEKRTKAHLAEQKQQQLLSDYLNKVNKIKESQNQIEIENQQRKKQVNERLERLDQVLKLALIRKQNTGKYQVYWGSTVFLLWCISLSLILIKNKINKSQFYSILLNWFLNLSLIRKLTKTVECYLSKVFSRFLSKRGTTDLTHY